MRKQIQVVYEDKCELIYVLDWGYAISKIDRGSYLWYYNETFDEYEFVDLVDVLGVNEIKFEGV